MASSSMWWNAVWRALVTGAVTGAVTLLASVVISPFGDWAQETALCRGASGIIRDVNAIGQTTRDGPSNQTLSGSYVTPLMCTYPDGQVRSFGDDEVTRNGFVFAFVVGFVPGTAVSLIRRSIRQVRNDRSVSPTTPAAASDSDPGVRIDT